MSKWLYKKNSDSASGLVFFSALFFLIVACVRAPRPESRKLWPNMLATVRDRFDLILPMLALAVLILRKIHFTPLWDSMFYARCIGNAYAERSMASLNCLHYNSYPYVALIVTALHLFGRSFVTVHFLDLVLGCVALYFFWRIYRAVLAGRFTRRDALCATALLAVNPLFGISILNTNFDFPILVAALGFLCFLIEREVAPAALWGCLLCFSKVTGAAHYFSLIGLLFLLSPFLRTRLVLGRNWLLFVPGLAYAVVVVTGHFADATNSSLGENVDMGSLPTLLFDLNFASPRLHDLLAGISLLSFSWPLAIIALLLLGRWLWSIYANGQMRPHSDAWMILIIAFFSSIYVTSRVLIYFNPRYFLYSHVLLTLCGTCCLSQLGPRLRSTFFVALIPLVAASNFWTFDPVAKRFFGTFQFGDHEMLAMGKLDGWSSGRDQIVYSPEITVVDRLLSEAYSSIGMSPETMLVGSGFSNEYHLGYVSAKKTRTAWAADGFAPKHGYSAPDASEFFVLAEPYFGSNALIDTVAKTFPLLQLVKRWSVSDRNYRLEVGHFAPKPMTLDGSTPER